MVGAWKIIGTETDWSALKDLGCGTALRFPKWSVISHMTLQPKRISGNIMPGTRIFSVLMNLKQIEPSQEKTCLRGFQLSLTHTGLYSNRRGIEA